MKRYIKSSTTDRAIRSNSWSDFIQQIEDLGYEVDSVNKRKPEQWLTLYKNGQEYEAEVTRYSDHSYELDMKSISKI